MGFAYSLGGQLGVGLVENLRASFEQASKPIVTRVSHEPFEGPGRYGDTKDVRVTEKFIDGGLEATIHNDSLTKSLNVFPVEEITAPAGRASHGSKKVFFPQNALEPGGSVTVPLSFNDGRVNVYLKFSFSRGTPSFFEIFIQELFMGGHTPQPDGYIIINGPNKPL